MYIGKAGVPKKGNWSETVGISNDKWDEKLRLINRETQNEIGFGGTKGKWCQSNVVY